MKTFNQFRKSGKSVGIRRRKSIPNFLICLLSVIVLTIAISVTIVNADTVLYTDEYGNEYLENDLVKYMLDDFDYSLSGKWDINISASGNDNLHAYLFNNKNATGEFILYIDGESSDIVEFNCLYDSNDYSVKYYNGQTISESLHGLTPSEWKSDPYVITPWATLGDYNATSPRNKITTVVIGKGCNPDSYDFLFGYLTGLKEVIFESEDDSDLKTPTSTTMMLSNATSQLEEIQLGNLVMPNDSDVQLGKNFYLFNKTGNIYTRLKYEDPSNSGSFIETTNELISTISSNVYDLEGNPSDLAINCLSTNLHEVKVLYEDENGVKYKDNEYKERLNIASDGISNLWVYLFKKKDQSGEFVSPEEYLIVYAGDFANRNESKTITSWITDSGERAKIKKAVVSKDFNPGSWRQLIYNLSELEEIEIECNEGQKKQPTNLNSAFCGLYKLKNAEFLKYIDPSNCHDYQSMLNTAQALKKIDLSCWASVPEDSNFNYFNGGCINVEVMDLSTITVQGTNTLFQGCNNIKLIMLPKIKGDINPNTLQSGGNNLCIYNYDKTTDTYTQLKVNDSEHPTLLYDSKMPILLSKGTKTGDIITNTPPTTATVTDMDGNPTDLEVNCFSLYISEPVTYYVDENGYEYTDEDLVSPDTIWNISEDGTSDLYGAVFNDHDNDGDYLLVIFGESKAYSKTKYDQSSNTIPWLTMDNSDKIKRAIVAKGCDPAHYNNMFYNLTGLSEVVFEIEDGVKKKPDSFEYVFNKTAIESFDTLNNIDTSSVSSMFHAFANMTKLEELDINSWDVSQCSNFASIFEGDSKLKNLNLSNWYPYTGTGNNFEAMFKNCESLEYLNLSKFRISTTNWSEILKGCSSLEIFILPEIPVGIDPLMSDSLSDLMYCNYDKDTNIYTLLKVNGSTRSDNNSFAKPIMLPKDTKLNDEVTLFGYPALKIESLTDINDEPTDLKVNAMITESALNRINPRVTDIILEEKTYHKGDELEITIKCSDKVHIDGEAVELKFSIIGNASNCVGTGNVATATFKEISDNEITFTYTISDDDTVAKNSIIRIESITNMNSIRTTTDDTLVSCAKQKVLANFEIEKAVTPSGGGKRKTEKKEEPIIPVQEEPAKTKKAIMEGYEDKTFKPNEFASREEVATIIAKAYSKLSDNENAKNNNFNDVLGRWSEDYIGFLKSINLVQGLEDGLYHPTDIMTRAQLAVLICNFDELNITNDEDDSKTDIEFLDIKGRWFEPYAKKVASLGIFIGYDDCEFKGDRPVSRAELAIIMNRIYKRNVKEIPDEFVEKVEKTFTDVKETDWYFKDIAEAILDLPESWFEQNEN